MFRYPASCGRHVSRRNAVLLFAVTVLAAGGTGGDGQVTAHTFQVVGADQTSDIDMVVGLVSLRRKRLF